MFPGVHHYAKFAVRERDDCYSIAVDSLDGKTHLRVEGCIAEQLPPGSQFGSLAEAADFFQRGAIGYSVTSQQGIYDGLELQTQNWSVRPLAIEHLESSFFDNRELFPAGLVEFDSALLMQGIEHEVAREADPVRL